MFNSAPRRLILPFAPQKSREPFNAQVEEAAVYALAELERMKGGGLILKQPEEKLLFLSKIGYPLWLYPTGEAAYLFDGLNGSAFTMSYFELPAAKGFMDSLEDNSKTREGFMTFLSDHNNYFTQPKREKELSLSNLIVDVEFLKELDVYRKEAVELAGQPENLSLLPPRLDEAAIASMLTEIGNLQATVRMDTETFQECLRLLNKTTGQFITELDYAAEAVKDEANAKIKAQEEVINPKIAALNSQYKRRIADLTSSFDQELENLGKQRAKTQSSIESGEVKIRLYQREAEAQASKNHSIYEKRWREKSAQAKKELDGLKKDLKRAQKNIKNLTKQKEAQTAQLKAELDAEIKHARQPIVDLEKARDAEMLVFKRETEKLLRLEKPMVDGLNGAINLGEAVSAKFALLGFADQQLKTSALFYVPFYVACYQSGFSKRFLFLPPLTSSTMNFVAKLKGAFGASRIKQVLTPRFKSISVLIDSVQELAKQESLFESQIVDLGEKNNLLIRQFSRGNIVEGLGYLRAEGWLSDKEYQAVKDSLA
jgi:hypothetical protein